MTTLRHLLHAAAIVATAQTLAAAVPGSINYQGRLTDATGVPQPGPKAMSLKIYDAATAGTQLYAEALGTVTADANGVYSFQFGAAGTSDTLVTETLATTDGTAATYQQALSHPPVLPGTVSVTDGTFSWNETSGNPGAQATASAIVTAGFVVGATVTDGGSGYTTPPAVTITGNGTGTGAVGIAAVEGGTVTGITITNAGSGYTSGATITLAPPPAPFVVNYSGGTITATYDPAPPAGRTISATYRYSASGISGALAAGAEQWLELTVDGVTQAPRQRILTVPFAIRAEVANMATNENPATAKSIEDLNSYIQRVNLTGVQFPNHQADTTTGGLQHGSKSTIVLGTAAASWDSANSRYSSKITLNPPGGSGQGGAHGWALIFSTRIDARIETLTGTLGYANWYYGNAEIRLEYSDGTTASMNSGIGDFSFSNPNPAKHVRTVGFLSGTPSDQNSTIYVSNLRAYPIPNQERYIDVNLGVPVTSSAVSLVTDSFDQSNISYSVIGNGWTSERLAPGKKSTIPTNSRITGLRIFLGYPPETEDHSGATIQAYSLRYW